MSIIWCMVWDMKHDRQNFLSFWAIFCTFTPLTTQKIKILKIWKKAWISSFSTSVPKIMIICYTVPEICCVTDEILIFHFGLFFALLLLIAQKTNFFYKRKRYLEILSFITNHDHMLHCYWDMVHDRVNCYFSFWAIICLFNSDSPKNQNFFKNYKNGWRHYHFTYVYQKLSAEYSCIA